MDSNPIPNKNTNLPYKDKVSFLVQLFIKKDIVFSPADFKREMVAVSRLIKEYPDFNFFYSLTELTGNFNSLLGLTGKYWKPKLQERYKTFIFEKSKNKKIVLQKEPVIKIELSHNKPKNILEFLSN